MLIFIFLTDDGGVYAGVDVSEKILFLE